jgi:hypothetical protein
MVFMTGGCPPNDPYCSFIHLWVTRPPAPASFPLMLSILSGTTSKGVSAVVRNPSAAHHQSWTERRRQGGYCGSRGHITSTVQSPPFAEVSPKHPKLRWNQGLKCRYTTGQSSKNSAGPVLRWHCPALHGLEMGVRQGAIAFAGAHSAVSLDKPKNSDKLLD